MGGGEAAIGVDTVSPGMIRNRTTVDSGGNVGLPGRQALHTQASSATLSQQPHPPREVDATWHLPPVFIFRPVRQWVWIHEDTGRPASNGGASQKFNGSGPVIDEAAPEKNQIPLCVPRPPNCGGKGKARDSVREDTRFSPSANRAPSITKTLKPRSIRPVEPPRRVFLPNIVRRTCFREWRKGYNAAT